MESLEKFIEKRAQQSEFIAMMIPRYLATPDAFLGTKSYTMEQADEHIKEAKKCRDVLIFLTDYKMEISRNKMTRLFQPKEIVKLDADMANSGEVEVVRQTPMRKFTTIKSGNSEWDVMTYRLTPLIELIQNIPNP